MRKIRNIFELAEEGENEVEVEDEDKDKDNDIVLLETLDCFGCHV